MPEFAGGRGVSGRRDLQCSACGTGCRVRPDRRLDVPRDGIVRAATRQSLGLCEIGGWFVRVLSRIYSATAFWSPRPGTPGRGLGRGAASRRILPLTPTLSPKTFAVDVTPNGTLQRKCFGGEGANGSNFAQPRQSLGAVRSQAGAWERGRRRLVRQAGPCENNPP